MRIDILADLEAFHEPLQAFVVKPGWQVVACLVRHVEELGNVRVGFAVQKDGASRRDLRTVNGSIEHPITPHRIMAMVEAMSEAAKELE